ncbi:MAG: hypothetical protein EBT86_08435 [Actinobacteria bacterium]|nr:hypothetical protein [Actinomycetota bacterium]
MKINELIKSFEIWTSIEERELLSKLKKPVRLSTLPEREQQVAEALIRKSLLIKLGSQDPKVIANEHR